MPSVGGRDPQIRPTLISCRVCLTQEYLEARKTAAPTPPSELQMPPVATSLPAPHNSADGEPNILRELLEALPPTSCTEVGDPHQQCPLPAPPSDDTERVQAVRALHQIGTPPNPRLDTITALMKSVFHVPVCMLTLIDKSVVYASQSSHSSP